MRAGGKDFAAALAEANSRKARALAKRPKDDLVPIFQERARLTRGKPNGVWAVFHLEEAAL